MTETPIDYCWYCQKEYSECGHPLESELQKGAPFASVMDEEDRWDLHQWRVRHGTISPVFRNPRANNPPVNNPTGSQPTGSQSSGFPLVDAIENYKMLSDKEKIDFYIGIQDTPRVYQSDRSASVRNNVITYIISLILINLSILTAYSVFHWSSGITYILILCILNMLYITGVRLPTKHRRN